MKFEEREKNAKPEEGSKNLPVAVLFVLVGVICLLLFIGWKYFSDSPSTTEEMMSTRPDAVASQIENGTGEQEILTDESVASASQEVNTAVAEEALPEITIPNANGKVVEETKPEPAKKEVPTSTATAEAPKTATTPAPAAISGAENYTYVVNTGETFYSIARKFNVSPETLKSMNPSVDATNIKVGVTKIKAPIQGVHTVGPGDILRVVANKYGVTVEQLMKANGKTKNNAQRGEKLIIPVK